MGVKVRFRKGAWWLVIHHAGRRKKKRSGSDRETAQRVARAVREKLLRGDLNLEPATDESTLTTYATAWVKTMRGTLKVRTVDFYEANLRRHILPALGSRPVSALRRTDCRELVASCREKGLSTSTVRGIARTVSTILTQAVDDDLLIANPALRLGKYLRRADDPEPEIRPFSRDEAA